MKIMPTPTVETNRIATSYGLMDHLTNYASRMGVTLDSKGQLCAKKLSEQIYAFCGNSYTNSKALYCPTPTYCNENYHVSFTDGGINYGANLILNDTEFNQLALLSNVTLNYTANLIQITSLSFSNSKPYTYAINISQFLAHKNVNLHMNFTYTLSANVTYSPTTANYQTSIQYAARNVSNGQTSEFVDYHFKSKNSGASVKTEATFTVENFGYYDVYCRVYSAHNASITAQRRLTIKPNKVTSIDANLSGFPTYIITDNYPFTHLIRLYGDKMPCPRIVGVTSGEDVYFSERIYGEETLFELADDSRIIGSAPTTNVTVKFPYRDINGVSITYFDEWSALTHSSGDYNYSGHDSFVSGFANSATFFAYNYSDTDNDKVISATSNDFWYIRPATNVMFYTANDDPNPSNILYMYDEDGGTMYNIVCMRFAPFNCHIKAINFTLKDSSNTDYSSDISFYPNVLQAWTDVKPANIGWVNHAYEYGIKQDVPGNNLLIPYMTILEEFQITNAPSTQYTLTCDVTLYNNTHLTATKTYMLRFAKQPSYHIHVDYVTPDNGWTSRYYYIEPASNDMGVAVKIDFYGVGNAQQTPHYDPTIVLGESTGNLYDVTFELDDYYGDTHYYMLAFVVSRVTNYDNHYFTITPKFKKRIVDNQQGIIWTELNSSQIDYAVSVDIDQATGHCSFDIDIYEFKYEDIDKYGLLLHDVFLGGNSYRTINNWSVVLPWYLPEQGGGMQPGYELEFDTFLTEYFDEEDYSVTIMFNDI